jgi:hypothetical protein
MAHTTTPPTGFQVSGPTSGLWIRANEILGDACSPVYCILRIVGFMPSYSPLSQADMDSLLGRTGLRCGNILKAALLDRQGSFGYH